MTLEERVLQHCHCVLSPGFDHWGQGALTHPFLFRGEYFPVTGSGIELL